MTYSIHMQVSSFYSYYCKKKRVTSFQTFYIHKSTFACISILQEARGTTTGVTSFSIFTNLGTVI